MANEVNDMAMLKFAAEMLFLLALFIAFIYYFSKNAKKEKIQKITNGVIAFLAGIVIFTLIVIIFQAVNLNLSHRWI